MLPPCFYSNKKRGKKRGEGRGETMSIPKIEE
jgi:hypothetical protein